MVFDVATISVIVLVVVCILICCFACVVWNFSHFSSFFQTTTIDDNFEDDISEYKYPMGSNSNAHSSRVIADIRDKLAQNKLKLNPEIDEDLQGLSLSEVRAILPELMNNVDSDQGYTVIDIGSKIFTTVVDKKFQNFILGWLRNHDYSFVKLRKGIYKVTRK